LSEHKPVSSFGAYSARQLATLIGRLRSARSFKNFLVSQDETYVGRPEGRDNIFKFLRACEYGLPQHFAVIELFVKLQSKAADYSLFVGGLSSWFKPDILKELDEEGVPIQISERFYADGDTKASLKRRLKELPQTSGNGMTEFEQTWIQEAL
jgi:hypothetical protein